MRGEAASSTSLASLLDGTGVKITRGTLAGIDADRRRALTGDGRKLPFRRLIIAMGARREPFLGHPALTFRGAQDAAALRGLLDEVKGGASRGVRSRLAVVVPPGPGWSLPAYELAFLVAADLRHAALRDRVEISLVTAEPSPLASLIAAELGAAVEEIAVEPTLRAFLLEGLEERYLRGWSRAATRMGSASRGSSACDT